MSQHWEDRDAEQIRQTILIFEGADPRRVVTRSWVEIGLAMVAGVAACAGFWWGIFSLLG